MFEMYTFCLTFGCRLVALAPEWSIAAARWQCGYVAGLALSIHHFKLLVLHYCLEMQFITLTPDVPNRSFGVSSCVPVSAQSLKNLNIHMTVLAVTSEVLNFH